MGGRRHQRGRCPPLAGYAVSPFRKLRASSANASLIACAPSAMRLRTLVLRPLAAKRAIRRRRVFSRASSRRIRISALCQRSMIHLNTEKVRDSRNKKASDRSRRPPSCARGASSLVEQRRRSKHVDQAANLRRGGGKLTHFIHRASFYDGRNTRNSITRQKPLSNAERTPLHPAPNYALSSRTEGLCPCHPEERAQRASRRTRDERRTAT